MNKSLQMSLAFAFGVIFISVMLAIAILMPYPSPFQLLTFRVTLALAAGGVAAMIPGFLRVELSNHIRAGGALAAAVMVYFFNPAVLTVQGTPTQLPGLFVEATKEDAKLVEYFWKQGGVRFRFPKEGWKISTKAAEAGLGDMTLEHQSGKDAQIQLHVIVLDEKYRDEWAEFKNNTTNLWKGTISQFGPFAVKDIFIDGRSSFKIDGKIRGQEGKTKSVTLIYAPLGDNRLFEMHLTRDNDNAYEEKLISAYNLIASTIEFSK